MTIDEAIRKHADRVEQHESKSIANEDYTKQFLIEPFLEDCLDADFRNPNHIVREYRFTTPDGNHRKVDYMLFYPDGSRPPLEAKPTNHNYNNRYGRDITSCEQARHYRRDTQSNVGHLFDGRKLWTWIADTEDPQHQNDMLNNPSIDVLRASNLINGSAKRVATEVQHIADDETMLGLHGGPPQHSILLAVAKCLKEHSTAGKSLEWHLANACRLFGTDSTELQQQEQDAPAETNRKRKKGKWKIAASLTGNGIDEEFNAISNCIRRGFQFMQEQNRDFLPTAQQDRKQRGNAIPFAKDRSELSGTSDRWIQVLCGDDYWFLPGPLDVRDYIRYFIQACDANKVTYGEDIGIYLADGSLCTRENTRPTTDKATRCILAAKEFISGELSMRKAAKKYGITYGGVWNAAQRLKSE